MIRAARTDHAMATQTHNLVHRLPDLRRSPAHRPLLGLPYGIATLTAMVAAAFIAWWLVDRPLWAWVEVHAVFLEPLANRVTNLGKSDPWLILSGVAGSILVIVAHARSKPGRKDQRTWDAANACWFFFTAVALAGLSAHPFKYLIGRSRPSLLLTDHLYTFAPLTTAYHYNSFPSGHAAVCGGLFAALTTLLPRYWRLWLLLTLPIVATRIINGAHFLSDVIAGFALGALVAFAVRTIPAFRDSDHLSRPLR